MALRSGTSSVSSTTSSATSLSAPTSPLPSTESTRVESRKTGSDFRRDVVSAPAALNAIHSSSSTGSIAERTGSRSVSSNSSSELLIMKSAKAAKKKRNSLSARNVYATPDRSGVIRVGSGSGAPSGCSLM